MADQEIKTIDIPLNGRLITSRDATQLGEGDFQELENMRYGKVSPKSVSGMTKINTNVINAAYLYPRAGFHYKKDSPAETHVLVQGLNTGGSGTMLYQNTTAIPSAGDFSTTVVLSETTGAGNGKFSLAPQDSMVYCNEKESTIWGGVESRCSAFIVSDPGEAIKYDYSEIINNNLTDANNVATLVKGTDTGDDDSYTSLMLHMDGSDAGIVFTDSSTNTFTATRGGNVNTDTAYYKFGTASAQFDGTGDYLRYDDHTAFDFSGKIWTVDCWIRMSSSADTINTIYAQKTDDNNYFALKVMKSGSTFAARTLIVASSATVVEVITAYSMSADTWYHVEFSQNGNEYYIFINGVLSATSTDTDGPANYSGYVYIGEFMATAGDSDEFYGWIDELRVSKGICRHTENFSPMNVAYGGSSCYVYVGSQRPIQAAKWYIGTANATTAATTAYYWGTSGWTAVSGLVDNTSLTSKALAQTGIISFTSTVSTAKPHFYNKQFLYWYLFVFSATDDTTTIYQLTLDAPMQNIVDLWDGKERDIFDLWFYNGTKFKNPIIKIFKDDYTSDDKTTYLDISSLATTGYLVTCFTERMTGLKIDVIDGKQNANAADMTVSYWDGDAWTEVSNFVDGTQDSSGKTLGTRGVVTWDAPTEISEHRRTIRNSELLYCYKIAFSATLSANTYIDYISGIPAQKTIRAHAFPVLWQNRIVLLDEVSDQRNTALIGAQDAVAIFNGSDSTTLHFGGGEKLTAGGTLFSRYGSSIYESLIACKGHETWLVNGTGPADYQKFRISEKYGCVAPGTMRSCGVGYDVGEGLTRHILIWQAHNAVVVCDGSVVIPISDDIDNYFDPMESECIPTAMMAKSEAFYDESRYEYHWLFASGTGQTTLNKEFVYDLRKKAWFEIDRGTGNYLQIGFPVKDTTGMTYCYGGIDTGFALRLEYGTHFNATTDITSTFRLGDIAIGGWSKYTKIRRVKHICVSKTATDTVTMTHYGDCITTGTNTKTFTMVNSTGRVKQKTESVNWGNNVFHSLKCALTTDDENIGYEPIGLSIGFQYIREDTGIET